jgi:predicted NACHT family NTPase
MAAEIEFDAYLRSISSHYDKWWQLYTLTDAETKAQQKAEIFPFELMVQTVAKDRSSNPNDPALKDKEKIERFPVLDGIRKYVAEHQQVLLVGRPGSGKSTTLARLLLEEALAGQCIPVLVELRFLSDSTIFDRIQAFFQRHDLQLDRTQIKDLLFHQRLLLLMDGLNELPSEAARLDVAKFRQDYPKVSMIFTTRDLSLGGDFGLEKKLEMQPLTEAQMQAFVRSYVPEQAEAMLRQLKDRLREFGQTPLFLWMLCGLFRQTGQIPANLGEVFRAFTHGYEKHLKADVPVESDRRWWSALLQELAFRMTLGVPFGEQSPAVDVEFRVSISKEEAVQIFATFLQNKDAQAAGTAQRYLDDLLRYHLIELIGEEQVEFRHQLLQKYYAAEALLIHCKQIKNFEDAESYIDNHLKEHVFSFKKHDLDNKNVLNTFSQALTDPEPQVRAKAAESIGQLKIQAAIPNLTAQLNDPSPLVRLSIIYALGQLHAGSAIPQLIPLLLDESPEVRSTTAHTLGKIGNEHTIAYLLTTLKDISPTVRANAAQALGEIGSESTIPLLLEAFNDADDSVQIHAIESVSKIYAREASAK